MKITSLLFLLSTLGIFVGTAITGYHELPEKVASHFMADGVADGWMEKLPYTISMILLGLIVPIIVIGLMFALRFLPSRFLNVPNAAYWRSPENFPRACHFMLQSSFWFAGAFLLSQTMFNTVIMQANKQSPPRLDPSALAPMTAYMLIFTVFWLIAIVIRFMRVKK